SSPALRKTKYTRRKQPIGACKSSSSIRKRKPRAPPDRERRVVELKKDNRNLHAVPSGASAMCCRVAHALRFAAFGWVRQKRMNPGAQRPKKCRAVGQKFACAHSRSFFLDNTFRMEFSNAFRVVAENLSINALVMLSQSGRRLIESGFSIRETHGQAHGSDAIGYPVFWVNQRNGFPPRHDARIVNRNLGVAYLGGRNSGRIQYGDGFERRFRVRPSLDLYVEFAIKTDPRVARAEAFICHQIFSPHNFKEPMCKSVCICADGDVSVFRAVGPKGRQPLHALAAANRSARLFHGLISLGGDQ